MTQGSHDGMVGRGGISGGFSNVVLQVLQLNDLQCCNMCNLHMGVQVLRSL